MRHQNPLSKRLSTMLLGGIALGVLGLGVSDCKKKGGGGSKEFQTSEAKHNLPKIFDGAKGYFEKGAVVDRSGNVKPTQFPSSNGWFPATKCCKQKDKHCQPEGKGSFMKQPAFMAVGFEISDPHDYQYRIIASGTKGNSKVTIQAAADPKCDGKYILFEMKGTVDKEMRVQKGKLTMKKGVTSLD